MKLPLTISLLASNRIATLERCLDSLKPLLLQVPAELIVVFTGNDERVRRVAERYTDKILSFAWCNDFSAARNEGLKHAKGEWFLYLDDDEWFDDVTEICEFFQSEEYKSYNSASYIVRNYLNWDGSKYSDCAVYRMVRRTKDTFFQNPIHEELLPFYGPCKDLRSFVHHYGYLKKKVSKNTGKDERNVSLLLKDIENRPDYTKNYVQLAQEYCSQSNWEQAEELCRRGRSVCRKEEDRFRTWLQVVLVETLYRKKDYKQAEKEALQILQKEKPSELARLLLFEYLMGIYEEWEEFGKLSEYGSQFEDLLAYMEQNPQLWNVQQMGTVNRDKVINSDWLYPIRLNCVKAALELDNPERAYEFLERMPWEEESLIQAYYPLLGQWKESYPSLLHLLAGLPYASSYLMFQKMLCEEQKGNQEGADFLFCRCLEEIQLPYLYRQLLKKAMEEKKDFSLLLKRMDLDLWKNCISSIVDETAYGEEQYLWEAAHTLSEEYHLQRLWLEKLLWEKTLSNGFPMKEAFLDALEKYALCMLAFYKGQYREDMFEEDCLHLLPAECRMALAVLEALDNWKRGTLTETVRLFRQALEIYPQITGIIREALRLLKNEIEHPAPVAGPEFEQLAVQMKAALNAMVQSGQYMEAMSVLSQLLPLLPNDMELLKMHQIVLSNLAD